MALGDGIRRNIAFVEPSERALLRDALLAINGQRFPGSRSDSLPGGVTWWFKQDQIHQGTHVHRGPEFLPWHREIVTRLEAMLRKINPEISLHYWDWTQDPRAISGANLGGGVTGTLNLFDSTFMGYGGSTSASIDQPWLSAGYYIPGAALHRDATNNPADPPSDVVRHIAGSPATTSADNDIVSSADFPAMRARLENVHNSMHGFVSMGGQHISFRDPFVFLLHSNVDRLFAKWQTQSGHPDRLDPNLVYGSESTDPRLNRSVEPWSGGLSIRPWAPPENQGIPHAYKHPFIVTPPLYDTNGFSLPLLRTNAALYSGPKCYFFSADQYIRVTRGATGPGTIDTGYPKPISTWGWGAFGSNGIDAALYSGPKCYFFSGNQYIRVTRGATGPGTIDTGYPKPISTWGWGAFGSNGIDAALYSGPKCYFFSGNQYIRVTRGATGPGTVDPGYPKSISDWGWGSFGKRGIDAALYSGPKCYFFAGHQYVRVTRGTTGAGTVDPGYPKHISVWNWSEQFSDLWGMMSIGLR